jgi:hypothetical protein
MTLQRRYRQVTEIHLSALLRSTSRLGRVPAQIQIALRGARTGSSRIADAGGRRGSEPTPSPILLYIPHTLGVGLPTPPKRPSRSTLAPHRVAQTDLPLHGRQRDIVRELRS